jgi:hypothetical protein
LCVWRAPEILVLHLKRFSKIISSEKLDVPVAFPTRSLDMRAYVKGPVTDEPLIYDLFAVSVRRLAP